MVMPFTTLLTPITLLSLMIKILHIKESIFLLTLQFTKQDQQHQLQLMTADCCQITNGSNLCSRLSRQITTQIHSHVINLKVHNYHSPPNLNVQANQMKTHSILWVKDYMLQTSTAIIKWDLDGSRLRKPKKLKFQMNLIWNLKMYKELLLLTHSQTNLQR